MRKKYAAGSNVYCKCLSRDPLNFPSFGPLCFQTFHTFPCRHSFVCHSCWPRSDTMFSMSNLLPIMFLYSKPTEQPQKHGVRKCTLCVCMTTWNVHPWISVTVLNISTDVNERNMQYWNSHSTYKATAPSCFICFSSCSSLISFDFTAFILCSSCMQGKSHAM